MTIQPNPNPPHHGPPVSPLALMRSMRRDDLNIQPNNVIITQQRHPTAQPSPNHHPTITQPSPNCNTITQQLIHHPTAQPSPNHHPTITQHLNHHPTAQPSPNTSTITQPSPNHHPTITQPSPNHHPTPQPSPNSPTITQLHHHHSTEPPPPAPQPHVPTNPPTSQFRDRGHGGMPHS